MSVYKSYPGHNIAQGTLATFIQQPKSEGVKPTRRLFMGDGSVLDQGLYVELVWDNIENTSIHSSILSQLGLTSAKSAAVTIYARDDRYNWVRYNGTAIRPLPSWHNFFIQNMTIVVRDLVEIV